MPPKGGRLTSEQVAILRTWIDQGAEWPGERRRPAPLVVAPPAVPARGSRADWIRRASAGPQPDRRLHPGQAARARLEALARGRSADAGTSALVRSDRPAAVAGSDRRIRRRRRPTGLREAGRPVARQPPVRRALGAALAGRGPLRRHPRLRQGQAPAQRLAVSRLRDPGVRTPTSPTTDSSPSRSRATFCSPTRSTARRRWASSRRGPGTSSATSKCPRPRSTARSPATSTATT